MPAPERVRGAQGGRLPALASTLMGPKTAPRVRTRAKLVVDSSQGLALRSDGSLADAPIGSHGPHRQTPGVGEGTQSPPVVPGMHTTCSRLVPRGVESTRVHARCVHRALASRVASLASCTSTWCSRPGVASTSWEVTGVLARGGVAKSPPRAARPLEARRRRRKIGVQKTDFKQILAGEETPPAQSGPR